MDFRHLGAVRERLAVAGYAFLIGVDHYGIPQDHSEVASVLTDRDYRPVLVSPELREREPARDLHSVFVLRGNSPAAEDSERYRNDHNRRTAYEFYLRGLEYHRLGGVVDENLRQATRWFERAIEADANFARPRAMWVCARSGLPEFDWEDGERRTQRALELDPNDPEANRVMGSILMHRGAFDASRKYHEKAMAQSPSDAYVKGRSAAFYNFSGEPERALQLLDEAAELDPFLHVWCVEERVAVLYNLGRFRESIEAALHLTFQTRRSRLYRAAAHAALGETARACEIVAEAIANAPDLTTDYVEFQECYRDPVTKRKLIELLVSAGLPECAAGQSAA